MSNDMRQLEPLWIETQLRQIASLLIDAHRKGDSAVLDHYARRLPDASSVSPKGNFMRLIKVFHPDRLAVHVTSASECVASGNAAELQSLAAFLRFEEMPVTADDTRGKENGRSSFADADDLHFEESYGYSEDDFGFGVEDVESRRDSDSGYGDESDRESEYENPDDPFAEGAFLEALKREFFGNLDLFPDACEIGQIEGELDLSDYGLHDLSGAEYCVNIQSLNLAMNRIDNIWPLKNMARLEFLDLSSNVIEDADSLASLPLLSELDLSFNEIEDISFLLEMPSLSCVVLVGNPVRNPGVIGKLRNRGVIVIE